MRILFASHSADLGTLKVGSHHLSRELARSGHDVIHISTPVSLGHVAKIADPSIRQRLSRAFKGPRTDEDGVTHIVPFVVLSGVSGPRWLLRMMAVSPIGSWWRLKKATQSGLDVVLVDQPLLWDSINFLDRRVTVYRPTDLHFDAASAASERRLLQCVDAIVATSQGVLDDMLLRTTRSVRTLVLENGVDTEHFRSDCARWETRSGVVYLGALDDRFGWETLDALARKFPATDFRIAGPVTSAGDKALAPNVHLLGGVMYVDAGTFLASGRVGLLPYSDHPGNNARSPMKFYEYLAAQLWVVASYSPSLSSRSAPGVHLYHSDDEAEALLRAALDSSDSPNVEGARHADAFAWPRRSAALTDLLHLLVAEKDREQ